LLEFLCLAIAAAVFHGHRDFLSRTCWRAGHPGCSTLSACPLSVRLNLAPHAARRQSGKIRRGAACSQTRSREAGPGSTGFCDGREAATLPVTSAAEAI
jgi:hypothetical protein